jgi:hypothetical protein
MIAQLDMFNARTQTDWREVNCIGRENTVGNGGCVPTIRYIGGQDDRGRPWRVSADEAVRLILGDRCTFYVLSSGVRVRLTVAMTADGSKCLSTELDDDQPLTLLALPEYSAWIGDSRRRRHES